MVRWKLFVLPLMLALYVDSKVSVIDLEKTMGREPNVSPVCSYSTQKDILLIVCTVCTEASPGEECSLFYRLQRDFENKCDPRVRLKEENQTVVLDLTSLTPVDSGNYTCECATTTGTHFIHLNITVKEDEASSSVPDMSFTKLLLIGVVILIIIIGIILGFIYRVMHHGNRRRPERPASSPLTDQGEPDNPYEVLQHPSRDLYDTVTYEHHPQDAKSDDCTSGNRRYRD